MVESQKKVRKLALDSHLLTVQILTNDVQLLILCLSYLITTAKQIEYRTESILLLSWRVPGGQVPTQYTPFYIIPLLDYPPVFEILIAY